MGKWMRFAYLKGLQPLNYNIFHSLDLQSCWKSIYKLLSFESRYYKYILSLALSIDGDWGSFIYHILMSKTCRAWRELRGLIRVYTTKWNFFANAFRSKCPLLFACLNWLPSLWSTIARIHVTSTVQIEMNTLYFVF